MSKILENIHTTALQGQRGFQEPATTIRERIILLYYDIYFILIVAAFLVGWLLLCVRYKFVHTTTLRADKVFTHHTQLEIIWTTLPALILLGISVPSFALLYARDEYYEPARIVKAIGNQWYWTYEISTGSYQCELEAYILDIEECGLNAPYRLAATNALILPTETHIRVLVSSTDVLHSWAVPSLGVKIDGCPGRLNQVFLFIKRPGVYFGQCSEICGAYHGYMPIEIRAVPVK